MPVTLSLIRKTPVGGNVWSFVLAPSEPLRWIAGQFVRVGLPHKNPDAEGANRRFTIASPPHERDIQITTRITPSTFKQALAALPSGGVLNLLDHPAGDFIWPKATETTEATKPTEPARPLVFAAQGIGITPFYSMLRDRLHRGLPMSATLVYANLKPPVPFEQELQAWAAGHPEFRLCLIARPISANVLGTLVPNIASSHIYVSGPGNLIELLGPPYNVPGAQLKQDFFPNYDAASY